MYRKIKNYYNKNLNGLQRIVNTNIELRKRKRSYYKNKYNIFQIRQQNQQKSIGGGSIADVNGNVQRVKT
ncbi:MAG: hypothetical protein RHS_1440 [Robinsoniella sp. RHS]|nr:MAG: hypothetical protein RHS_1440 [Robinsoniella sp. RHS]